MELQNLRNAAVREMDARRNGNFVFLVSALVLLCGAGCGAPGEPTPPSPPVPAAITDLTAHQAGDGVQLIFTLPLKTVTGDRLASPPAVEVVRGMPKTDGSPDARSLRVVYTIPGALVENYVVESQVKFIDPVAPAETRAHPGGLLVYVVRTSASKKRSSANSNAVSVRMYPVAEAIASLQARVTETAIELSWTAPTRTSGGDPLSGFSGYRIYRGELDPATAEASSGDLSKAKWKFPLALLSGSDESAYRDTLFDFGRTYAYIVRSVVLVEGNPLESRDSKPLRRTWWLPSCPVPVLAPCSQTSRGPSILKPILRATASIEVRSRTHEGRFLSPISCLHRRIVIPL
jgi:hypothetical protein